MELWIGRITYGPPERLWMNRHGHYLSNAPPSCLFCIGVHERGTDLVGGDIGVGPILGMCTVGRPVARMLPQDGSVGEITRMYLINGLPHGTASAVLRACVERARRREMKTLIAYHDRTRHTGCIYRKAGFKKDGLTAAATGKGWGTREGRVSAEYEATPKRRWAIHL